MTDELPGIVSRAISLDLPSMIILKEEGLKQHKQISNLHSIVCMPTLFKCVLLLLAIGNIKFVLRKEEGLNYIKVWPIVPDNLQLTMSIFFHIVGKILFISLKGTTQFLKYRAIPDLFFGVRHFRLQAMALTVGS